MKLLIVTQVIDTEHPVLGFFHRWVEEFAKHCEQVHVICLQAGKHNLPANVTVHSLGKEEGKGRFTYLVRFYQLIWRLRHEYDSVFVHMNQEYILLGGVLWKLLGRNVSMWRNHYSGSFLTRLAARFCKVVFYTSSSSYTKRFGNAHAMPIGLDAETFKAQPGIERKSDALLYVGRISPSKRIDVLLSAFRDALKKHPSLTLSIVGGTTCAEDEKHQQELRDFAIKHALPVVFVGPVPWVDLPKVYSAHELCINLSPPGMFDKVIGESLLCECDILTSNQDLREQLGERCTVDDVTAEAIASKLTEFVFNVQEVRQKRESIRMTQSLESLVKITLEKINE